MRESNISEFNFGNLDNRLSILEDKDTVFGHFVVNEGQATICGARVGDKLYYSISLCAPQDNFSKRYGRYLAQQHMITHNGSKRGVYSVKSREDCQPGQLLFEALVCHLKRMRNAPTWIGKTPAERDGIKVIFRNYKG